MFIQDKHEQTIKFIVFCQIIWYNVFILSCVYKGVCIKSEEGKSLKNNFSNREFGPMALPYRSKHPKNLIKEGYQYDPVSEEQ